MPISLSTVKFITPRNINLLIATPWILDKTCNKLPQLLKIFICKVTSISDYSEDYPYLFSGSYSNGQQLTGGIYNKSTKGIPNSPIDFDTVSIMAGFGETSLIID